FIVAVGNDATWQRLARLLDELEGTALGQEARFATNTSRVAHRQELIPLLEALFARRPAAVWLDHLRRAQIPCGPVHDLRSEERRVGKECRSRWVGERGKRAERE